MRNMTTKLATAVLSIALLAAAAIAAPQASSTSGSGSSATHQPSTTKKKKSSHHHSARREPFQKSPTASRISEIQTALSRGGYFEGEPNGKWDSTTIAAMQKFQSANGLNSSGKIDATTLQKLGLGSSTAGVDAPKPVKKSDPNTSTNAALRPPSATKSASAANANSASNVTPAPAAATAAASATKPQH
jgi:peptidoglycan hydrolase-like protein with peptidoglycan-binding domain